MSASLFLYCREVFASNPSYPNWCTNCIKHTPHAVSLSRSILYHFTQIHRKRLAEHLPLSLRRLHIMHTRSSSSASWVRPARVSLWKVSKVFQSPGPAVLALAMVVSVCGFSVNSEPARIKRERTQTHTHTNTFIRQCRRKCLKLYGIGASGGSKVCDGAKIIPPKRSVGG